MRKGKPGISETCECGGKAVFFKWDNEPKNERIPILKCKKCGDTFDAHEKHWRKKTGKPPRVKYLPRKIGKQINISKYPNFRADGSVRGMREKFYGNDALLVRSGNFIYNVSSNPRIYRELAY